MKKTMQIILLASMPAFVFFISGMTTSTDGAMSTVQDDAATFDSRSAAEIWKEECASCHGLDGKGQTKAGKRAGVKDFTDPEYQKSWTDEEALKVVSTATKDGKQLKNKKPWGEKLTQPELKQMVLYVRQFAK